MGEKDGPTWKSTVLSENGRSNVKLGGRILKMTTLATKNHSFWMTANFQKTLHFYPSDRPLSFEPFPKFHQNYFFTTLASGILLYWFLWLFTLIKSKRRSVYVSEIHSDLFRVLNQTSFSSLGIFLSPQNVFFLDIENSKPWIDQSFLNLVNIRDINTNITI